MRVVHLSTQHPALDVRIFQKQCRTLARHGYDTHLLTEAPPARRIDGVHMHALPRPAGRFRPGRIWRRLAQAYRVARGLGADVYHFHDPELITIGLMLQRQGARVIYDVHEHTCQEILLFNKDRPLEKHIKSKAFAMLEEMAKRRLDAFVAATPWIASQFPPERTVLVQNFPLRDEFDPAAEGTPYRARPAQVMYAGGITAVRGIREMLGAIELVTSARFMLLGDFATPELQREAAALPGWQRTRYLGWQSRAAMTRWLSETRVGLVLYHPDASHVDAYPNKMFEYMAAGLPVVASNFPLWRQILEETGAGLVVDPLDPASIAAAIEYLLTHPDEAEAMGRRGHAAVEQRYNWDAEASKLLELYGRLQSGRLAA
jgi:glycosyltransferase involved in cell wall biosynthesis